MKNKRRRGYKFTDKRHTVGGIFATILAIFSIILFTVGVSLSFIEGGNAGLIVGIIGLIVFLVAVLGFVIGIKSFKEEEKYYFLSWVGSILNAVIFIGMGILILLGI